MTNLKIDILKTPQDYTTTYEKMTSLVLAEMFASQIWLLEHTPVFTMGITAKTEDILDTRHNIPLIHTDRGGQLTYHAPGQLICYMMLDLATLGLGVKSFVRKTEQIITEYLDELGIPNGKLIDGRPGVFIEDKKIASIGFKIRKNRTYHGFSINMNMDLRPFTFINPCGASGLAVTQTSDLVPSATLTKDNLSKLSKILQTLAT